MRVERGTFPGRSLHLFFLHTAGKTELGVKMKHTFIP